MISPNFASFEAPDIPPGMGFLVDHGSPMMAPGKSQHTLPPLALIRQTSPHPITLSAPHLRPSSAAPGGESISRPQLLHHHQLPPQQHPPQQQQQHQPQQHQPQQPQQPLQVQQPSQQQAQQETGQA